MLPKLEFSTKLVVAVPPDVAAGDYVHWLKLGASVSDEADAG